MSTNVIKKIMPLIHNKNRKSVVAIATLVTILGYTLSANLLNNGNAESGVGKDIFKVVVSIFGVTNDTGDIVATATVNGHSKAKFFGLSSANLTSAQNSSVQNERIVEFVATFPKVVVNAGDSYKACVITLDNMHIKCNEGHNSPAKRAEFADISLGKDTKAGN
jgi:hypothetical protein